MKKMVIIFTIVYFILQIPTLIAFIFQIYIEQIIKDSGFPYYPWWIPFANFRQYPFGELVRDSYILIYGENYGITIEIGNLLLRVLLYCSGIFGVYFVHEGKKSQNLE